MIKKSLLILISLFVFMSCSKPVTSPNNNEDSGSEVLPPLTEEEELIAKYGVDINQDNSVIKQQIKEKLQAYFQEKGSYRVIFTGIPKVGRYDWKGNNSPHAVLVDSVIELGLKDVTIDVDIRNINFIDGFLEKGVFSSHDKPDNTGLVFNYIFPEDKITTIEIYAFAECYCIKELVIPDSVTTIEDGTFFHSPYLKKVTFGKGLKTIESSMAFSYCTSLEEVILNEGLTSIGEWAFYSTAIKQIAIPASVTYIGSKAFAICNNLTTIIYYGDSPDKIKLYTVDILQNSPNVKTLIIPNAINPDDERWKTFLGGNFTDIRKQ